MQHHSNQQKRFLPYGEFQGPLQDARIVDGFWGVKVMPSSDKGREEADEWDEEEKQDEAIAVLRRFLRFPEDENGWKGDEGVDDRAKEG